MEQFLEKLFNSIPRARIIRLFMQNYDSFFELDEIIKRIKLKKSQVKKELNFQLKLGILQKKPIRIVKEKKSSKKTKNTIGYSVNYSFPYISEVKYLAVKSSIASREKITKKIKSLGRIQLAVLCGLFVNNSEQSRTDLFIVGSNLNKNKLNKFLSELESDIGKHIRYTIMDKDEFKYRLDMFDRFIRDILEFKNQKLINKLNV